MDATVGAALRGRPGSKQARFCETGGHGEPPLQLYLWIQLNLRSRSSQLSERA